MVVSTPPSNAPPYGHCQRYRRRRINKRSAAVEQHQRVGHREAGSMFGKGSVRIVSSVDRKLRYTKLRRVIDGKADTTSASIIAGRNRGLEKGVRFR